MLQGRTLWELMERRVDATPDALMAVDEDMRTLTFAEFWSEAERAAAGLRASGLGEGDVVSWQLPTWIESLVLVAALSRLGVVQNPLLPIYREREVGFVTDQADSRLLVVPSRWRGFDHESMATGIAERHGREMRVLVTDKALPQGDPTQLPALPEPLDPGDQPARWIFYTSGTTADPKGAQHTDATIATAAKGMGERLALIESDRAALVFPFSHIGGITWLFRSLMFGSSLILVESFDPDGTSEVLSREGVTLAGSGTVFHQAYLAYQRKHLQPVFPHVRAFPGGGAPKPASLVGEVRAVFDAPILAGYGLTEAPLLTMADVADTDEELATSEGKPMPGVELRFVTLDGREALPGEEGEIRARAPQLMLGYLDPALDVEAFDEDGFFRTGDLGHLDDRGNLVVTGRVKDVIIRKGENVSAKEVEDLLHTHDKVGDVAVIGLPDPDSGERVCAVVQTAPGAEDITLDEVVDHLRAQGLMAQKLPEQLEIVQVIPRNPAGKVLKHVLRDEYKG
ncbi:class I adenylate-forming enzyme family protein [Dermatobacter hominis]|uniref:class I adenylate-forming enzyme family protein n=1 Tax=Dermatobacter hominis TaxID=2884263 RepID=UPI001D127DAF|nr:AMP-binding protein [Dermatobacter hominis]UDY37815.1 AMP-binding protein [Dermatobacter hominis]